MGSFERCHPKMLQKSRRVLVTTVGSTPEHVGPGTYEVGTSNQRRLYETPWRIKGVPYGGLNRTEQRFHYIDLKQRQNENPSPVEYAMVRFGDRISVHVPSASFASTTQRFKVKETDYPTAGRYDPQNGIFDKNIKCNDDYGSPFLTTAARFSDQHDMSRRNSHLGPNTYELENMSLAEKSMLEAKNKQTLKGAFGTKCARKLKLINSTIKTNIPAPGKYEVRSEVSRPVSVFGNSVFTSRSIRMGTAQKDKQNYPAPSDYVPHNYTISKDIMMEDEKQKTPTNTLIPAYYNDKACKPGFPRIKGKCTSPAYYQDKYLRQNPMVKVIKCPAKNRPTR